MTTATVHAASVHFDADRRIARWRPLVQWLLAIPHLVIANALGTLRGFLTLISFVTVLFTERIPRPLFDAIAMTYRYEWRAVCYALALHEDYPPFEFTPAAADDGHERHTALAIAYPERLNRWKPLYKWFLAIPHYVVLVILAAASVVAVLWGVVAVIITGQYPERPRTFLVGAYRYRLRVQTYAGLLTDEYPPFSLSS
ncbi:MAG: hypothetical protein QOE45_1524 [Frankiaceae bacterium]|jgi:hypothetical protein|nr:hypothetical protein [Frankiaceae bacterium]